jgi:ABC-type dipeptide/oligopeptide/nickel transport system permease subunit
VATAFDLEAVAGAPMAMPGVTRRLLRRRGAVVILALLALLVVTAVAAPFITPYLPTTLAPRDRFFPPSIAHPFGTDELGRDLLTRVLYGGRIALGIGAASTVIAMVVGVVWGFAAAMRRGWIDEILMRLADAAMAIPTILFALVLVAAFGPSTVNLAVIIGLLLAPVTARLARSAALDELKSEYILAAVASGATRMRILRSEVLPNTVPALLVLATLNAASAILAEASLSFVGLGVQPPEASWGSLLFQGYQKIYQSLWYAIFPGLIIFLAIWLLTLLADQLQSVLDPRGRESTR